MMTRTLPTAPAVLSEKVVYGVYTVNHKKHTELLAAGDISSPDG
jgi:hypothetical protein